MLDREIGNPIAWQDYVSCRANTFFHTHESCFQVLTVFSLVLVRKIVERWIDYLGVRSEGRKICNLRNYIILHICKVVTIFLITAQ